MTLTGARQKRLSSAYGAYVALCMRVLHVCNLSIIDIPLDLQLAASLLRLHVFTLFGNLLRPCRSISRASPKPGDPLMLQLFSSLVQLPAVPQLQYTASLLLGAYSKWLADSVNAGCPAELVAGLVSRLLLPGMNSASVSRLHMLELTDLAGE